ncbi:MAG: NADH-quinone oxidoreductase subunit NuoI [Candidatus Eisenbacteria bacterium]|nr:NADH-quinone oxidoreductase subunit NuoI [Candidatus Eisenbacteria bacterium]
MLNGFRLTLRHFFKRPVTVFYPERRRAVSARFRGLHCLARDEQGLEKCVGCGLCAKVCPSFAIEVEAAENTERDRHNNTERYASRYVIDIGRCIFCGYCEEVCPTQAISLTPRYEMADYRRESLYFTKSRLLEEEAASAGPGAGNEAGAGRREGKSA